MLSPVDKKYSKNYPLVNLDMLKCSITDYFSYLSIFSIFKQFYLITFGVLGFWVGASAPLAHLAGRLQDWSFNPLCWPDPAAMVPARCKSVGIELAVTFWPYVTPSGAYYRQLHPAAGFFDKEFIDGRSSASRRLVGPDVSH